MFEICDAFVSSSSDFPSVNHRLQRAMRGSMTSPWKKLRHACIHARRMSQCAIRITNHVITISDSVPGGCAIGPIVEIATFSFKIVFVYTIIPTKQNIAQHNQHDKNSESTYI